MDSRPVTQSKERRKLFVWADHYGFDNDDRMSFASYMLRRDVTTWKTLSDDDVLRLLDGFEGGHLLVDLLVQRGVLMFAPDD
jgi:hypothetical protein